MRRLALGSSRTPVFPRGGAYDKQHLINGDSARDRGDWVTAAEEYRRYLASRPDHFAIWVQLGHALKEAGRRPEALAAYSQALRLNDADADLLHNLGLLHKLLGHREIALAFYQRSAALDGNPHALAGIESLNAPEQPVTSPPAADGAPTTPPVEAANQDEPPQVALPLNEALASGEASLEDLRYCYRLLLGRAPDTEGFETYSRAVQTGMGVDQLVLGFIDSPEYVQRLAILTGEGHDPTAGEPAAPEDISYCYRLLLGRAPDPEGFEAHTVAVREGVSVDELVRRFAASSEYTRRIARPIESDAAMQPAPEFLNVDSKSEIDMATLDDLRYCYHLLLNRAPDPEGFDTYAGAVHNGMSVGELAREFTSSLEFTRRLNAPVEASDAATLDDLCYCYRLLLRREPDSEGFATFASAIENGMSRDALVRAFVASKEYTINNGAPASPEGVYEGDLMDLLASWCDGLHPTVVSDVVASATGECLKWVSYDPWILFQLNPERAATGWGLLTIEVNQMDPAAALNGKVYFDRGSGIKEACSFLASSANVISIILVAPSMITQIRWDPDDKNNAIYAPRIKYQPLKDPSEVEREVKRLSPDSVNIDRLRDFIQSSFNRSDFTEKEATEGTFLLSDFAPERNYLHWLNEYGAPAQGDYAHMKELEENFSYKPKFSIIIPTYNTPHNLLRECLDSILAQTYQNFEICVADDHSPDRGVVDILHEYAAQDQRVKFVARASNGHISAASNSALRLATGDFILLIDHDDLIPDYTLFTCAWYINAHQNADILYSDEDKIDMSGMRYDPYFKGNFNKYLMYGHNMINHLGVYRRSLVESVGGFRLGFEGSQDYDLFLRCYERTSEDRIVHIPHILYHWRAVPGSTAVSADQKDYAFDAAKAAISGHFERTGLPLRPVDGFTSGVSRVVPVREFDTRVSIIIPTRNGLDLLRPCIDTILAAPHDHLEILIIDNESDDIDTLNYMAELQAEGIAKIIPYPHPFNFSLMNNYAVEQATGDILCFLNNDTEVLSADWLHRARALLSIDEIGMVGAKLLYPDGTIQHFGVVLGLGDHRIAGHIHLHIHGDEYGYFGKARLMQEFSAVTGACIFMRKDIFNKIGGFDPELTVAYNDVDLCLKVRALGLKVIGDPDIQLIHKESKTRGYDALGPQRARLDSEAAWMNAKWSSDYLLNDPYYSPNHGLQRVDFTTLATPPRVPLPWQSSAK